MILSSITKPFLCAGAAALLLAALSSGGALSAPAPRVVGSCNPAKVKFVMSSRGTTTPADGVVINIPDAAFAFTQAKRGCVIVDFTAFAEVTDATQDSVVIRATLTPSGGTAFLARPTDARFQPANTNFDIRTVQFLFANVPPGAYTVRMLMAGNAATTTDTVLISSPNVVLHYN
jgi:hypothetical protein